MAFSRSLKVLDPASVAPSFAELAGREGFAALSQRKLNALAMPIAYVDHRQRYRFANKAFCEWIAKRP
ncbi:MAG TPA: hypothetical protein VFX05_00365, partial [Casimicrobiaceae bacterium]|nr:hypothetical protein [Casimicrobiaceae bacterium]